MVNGTRKRLTPYQRKVARQFASIAGAFALVSSLVAASPAASDNPNSASHILNIKLADAKILKSKILGVNVQDEIGCLAQNIYFEARGETDAGKLAVAHVVLNRAKSDRFPKTLCNVVKQGSAKRLYRCQFSWWCDGQSDEPKDQRMWEHSQQLARMVYWGQSQDPTWGALWYHADYVKPYWRRAMARGPKIGKHIFYRAKSKRYDEQLAGIVN